jgi:hypothetical protein
MEGFYFEISIKKTKCGAHFKMGWDNNNNNNNMNCEQKFTKISGNNTRTTLNRFFTKKLPY